MSNDFKPPLLWFNGSIIPWEDAKVHIWSEVAIRGANVFDSVRAYWNPNTRSYNLLALDEHVDRLMQSANLLKFPQTYEANEIREGIIQLLQRLNFQEHTYIRPTLYLESGRYDYNSANGRIGAYIVAFPHTHADSFYQGIKCCVSSWRRFSELTMSPRIKTGAAYMAFRLPKIEAMQNGYDEAILLNERDTVAEATGAALMIIKNKKVYTPPVYAGILESITRLKLKELLESEFQMEVTEREITRTELYTADEIFLCSTLSEVQPVVEIDRLPIGTGEPGAMTKQLQDRLLQICLGEHDKLFRSWLTSVHAGHQ